nr:hypothetical protein CFP56_71966 [Quercus suber]
MENPSRRTPEEHNGNPSRRKPEEPFPAVTCKPPRSPPPNHPSSQNRTDRRRPPLIYLSLSGDLGAIAPRDRTEIA